MTHHCPQSSLTQIQSRGFVSDSDYRMATTAQLNGGTIVYDQQSVININAGQNLIIQQGTVVQLAQLQNTNLDQRERARFVAGIDELQRAAWRKGGSAGAVDDDAKVGLCVSHDQHVM